MPLSGDLQRLAATVSVRNSDLRRAQDIARQFQAGNSTNYRDHLWVGQVLGANRQPSAEAEKALRRAVELAEKLPETWVALVQYLAGIGQSKAALIEIDRAHTKLPPEQAPLALAQCYEVVGDFERAGEQYLKAMQARPTDVQVRRTVVSFCLRIGRSKDAETHLRAILTGKLKAAETDVSWARRTLALTLANSSNPASFPEALALVGLKADDRGNVTTLKAGAQEEPVEDLIARARVLATHYRQPLRHKAIALFEEIGKRQALPPDDQLLLAQLYLANGPDDLWWAKARELMQGLVTTHARNPLYLGQYAQVLLDRGDTREAAKIIAKIEQVEKGRQTADGAFGSIELKARVLELQGKGQEALALLKSYVEADRAKTERLLLFAGLHGRLGQLKESLELFEGGLTKCPPEAVCGASLAVLHAVETNNRVAPDAWQQFGARVEQWLKGELQKTPENVVLQLQLADLLDLLGRAAEAETVYRQVLKQDGRNLVALNNLAWLLAQRSGGSEEGMKLINQAIELYGARPVFLDTRAVLALGLGQTPQAITDLQQAIRDAPTPSKYFHLMRAHLRANDRRAAQTAFQQATAAGLTVNRLPRSEREEYRRLAADLQK
jgi:tetratricopeptide (TPR) repeat protein